MGLTDVIGGIKRGAQKLVDKFTSSDSESELDSRVSELEENAFETVQCKHYYGLLEPNTDLLSSVAQFNTEIKSNYYRDFFFIELKPVKLKKKKGSCIPYFVFETEDASEEIATYLQDAFIELANETSDTVSMDVIQRWTSCEFKGPFIYMLDNVNQDFSHSNEYGLSFLSNMSNLLTQKTGQLLQLFYQKEAIQIADYATDQLLKLLVPYIQDISQYIGLPADSFARELGNIIKVMATGGRYDSPKVWNSSSSQFNLTATINLVADTTTPETVALKIVEPLLILWALSIPRSFENIPDAQLVDKVGEIAKYFYVWPYYVEATLYRGHPDYDNVKILRLPAAAIQGIRTSFSSESARYRGESIMAMKITFELIPVYNTVYGSLDTSSAMMTLGWFIKDSLANLIKLNRDQDGCKL